MKAAFTVSVQYIIDTIILSLHNWNSHLCMCTYLVSVWYVQLSSRLYMDDISTIVL